MDDAQLIDSPGNGPLSPLSSSPTTRDLSKQNSFSELLTRETVAGGYDPREIVSVFRLLDRKDEVQLEKLFYTDHPKLQDRISFLTSLLSAKSPSELAPDDLAQHKRMYQTATEAAAREDPRPERDFIANS